MLFYRSLIKYLNVRFSCSWTNGLTEDWWNKNVINKKSEDQIDENLIYKLVYFGGIEPHMRKKVIPMHIALYEGGRK